MTCAAMPVPAHIDTGMPFRRESIEREFLEGKATVSPATSASRYEDTIFSSSFRSSQSTSTLSSSRENSPSKAPPPQPTSTSTSTPSAKANSSTDATNSTSTSTSSITTTPADDDDAVAAAPQQPRDHPKQPARPRPEPIRTGHPFTSQILSPRPYEQIYAEMSYLTGSLHSEALKTAKLIGHYSLIEEALRGEAAVGKHRRRLRKQLSSLKCRIAQASLQEKAIRVRLSELQMEAQSRTTWIQLQQRRMVQDAGPLSAACMGTGTGTGTGMGAGAGSGLGAMFAVEQRGAGGGTASSQRKLNAACLEFVPGRVVAGEAGHMHCGGARGDGGFRNRGLEYHFKTYDAGPGRTDGGNGNGSMKASTHQRRPSLPGIIFIWPES